VSDRTLRLVVYGIINAGKSSLINALAGRNERPAGPIGGTTTDVAGVLWQKGLGTEDSGLGETSDSAGSSSLPPGGEGPGWGGSAGLSALENRGSPIVGESDAPPPQPSPTGGEGVRGNGDAQADRYSIELIDTPGLEEVGDVGHARLATEAARSADLVLFVLAEDLTATARRALLDLVEVGKPIVVALNKVDLLEPEERDQVLEAIRSSLTGLIPADHVVPIAAAPIVRRLIFLPGGGTKVETIRGEPMVEALEARLLEVLAESAYDLKVLAETSAKVEAHLIDRQGNRASLRERAERVADETSAALAVALAVNPLPLLDFLTGPGGLAILVRRVSEVYGEKISGEVARGLAAELIRGGRVVLWGSLAATVGGGVMKFLPGLGHLAGAITQGVSAGYFGHVVGRALVDYLENGHDWGDGGLVASLDRIAASTDRKAITRGIADRIKARLKGQK
jgi:small GTP-binding protein